MVHERKKNRRVDPVSHTADAPNKSEKAEGNAELYPDTQSWTTQQKERYLEENRGRIWGLVNTFRNIQDPALSRDDLFQEAQIAFWHAYDSYDPTRGTRFTTYAHKIMKNAVTKLLRSSGASKRKPTAPTVPYDTTVTDVGAEIMGGDNMEVIPSPLGHGGPLLEDHCIQREEVSLVHTLLQDLFSEEDQQIFLSLSQGLVTQKELAAELGCSQAKISMTYRFVKIRLNYELKQAGYSQ